PLHVAVARPRGDERRTGSGRRGGRRPDGRQGGPMISSRKDPQSFRLGQGGRVRRDKLLRFHFNGRQYEGMAGDTLASALLANGVHFVARSFKYHRPRGIMTAGVEEPNALVQLETGAWTVPNARATEVELYEGL